MSGSISAYSRSCPGGGGGELGVLYVKCVCVCVYFFDVVYVLMVLVRCIFYLE